MACGVILSGGMSRRFQVSGEPWVDKALHLVGGVPMIKVVAGKLSRVSSRLIVASGPPSRVPVYQSVLGDVIVVSDDPGLSGPLAGIYSAFRYCDSNVLIALPNDMPLISEELLELMINLAGEYDVVSPILPNGLVETTVLAVNVETSKWILDALKNIGGRSRVADLHRGAPRIYLVNVKSRGFEPREFKNINKREDLEREPSEYPEGPLDSDVRIIRDYSLEDVRGKTGKIIGSLWGTLLLGRLKEELHTYLEKGVYMFAAYTLLDSPNKYERALGRMIIDYLKPT